MYVMHRVGYLENNCSLFRDLHPDSDIKSVAFISEVESVGDATCIIRHGAAARDAVILLSGCCKAGPAPKPLRVQPFERADLKGFRRRSSPRTVANRCPPRRHPHPSVSLVTSSVCVLLWNATGGAGSCVSVRWWCGVPGIAAASGADLGDSPTACLRPPSKPTCPSASHPISFGLSGLFLPRLLPGPLQGLSEGH